MSRVAVRQDRQLVPCRPELSERRDDVRKRFQLLDFADEPANLVLRERNAAAVHDIRDCALPDLPVRRMPAVAERVDHRVLEMRTAPPGTKLSGFPSQPFCLRNGVTASVSPFCMSTMRPVLVERQRPDFALQVHRAPSGFFSA
jgi:hypothetical protein